MQAQFPVWLLLSNKFELFNLGSCYLLSLNHNRYRLGMRTLSGASTVVYLAMSPVSLAVISTLLYLLNNPIYSFGIENSIID